MSTALVSTFCGLEDVLAKNSFKMHMKVSERKSVPNIRRTSSVSIGSSQCSPHKLNVLSTASLMDSVQNHRKLDRSMSEPVDRSPNSNNNNNNTTQNNNNNNQQQQQQRAVQQANSSRYKTELCRPFEESGKCKYGDKCQFAHGMHELRTLARHPKYKTELCRTFHTIGFCPYGPRCHFIHNADVLSPGGGNGNGGSPSSTPTSTTAPHTPGFDTITTSALNNNNNNSGSSSLFRVKSFSFGSTGSTSSTDSVSSSLGSNSGEVCCFGADDQPFVTTPTANNAFTFNSQDFTGLLSPGGGGGGGIPLPNISSNNNQRVLQQNAYNTALSRFSLSALQGLNINNNADTNGYDPSSRHPQQQQQQQKGSPPPLITPPSLLEQHPPSPVDSFGSELDELSLCGSPPADCSERITPPRSPPRLAIFSRLSTSED